MIVKSQNKWPASKSPEAIEVVEFTVNLRKGPKKIALARPGAARLIRMIEWWDQNVEPVQTLIGYNFREIAGKAGTGNLSNHASGTGIDINHEDHPLAAEGTVPASKVPKIVAKAKELGLMWGGSYRGRKDEMHFDLIVPPEQSSSGSEAMANPNRVHVIARNNSDYVPPVPWQKDPWFWAVAGGGVITITSVAYAVLKRSTKPK